MPTLPAPLRQSAIAVTMLLTATLAAAQPAAQRRVVRADDGHPLTVWVKRPAASATKGSILLLHGRTWSARPNFDLQVPGQRLSLMDAFVARGYAVYALDQRGYGATPRDASGWLTPERAARDAALVLDTIAAEVHGARPALLGYSRGSLTAMYLATRQPDKASAVILYGFPMDFTMRAAAPVDAATPARRRTSAAGAGEDFITPERTLPGVKEEYVREATMMDSIRVDWRGEGSFLAMDPAQLRTPTLLIAGERDPYANGANPASFFPRIGTADKWWVVLPGVDHAAHLESQAAFVNAVVGFIERSR